ncbi:hypothetical protein [Xanthovirga aplysinae]|uniref:hypothetical protein n=1 Tax=Xanthovirga aplysinae TaxID=2529853 RepID=UPI0012BCCEB8|nr:hypothetical protein [Xanthovirga aplysinae]MTI31733.1 hypothetical protein [Xanthovirga aplysinae]
MAKLKNIIKQLSTEDYQAIHNSLIESNAEKSAYLLKSMREKQLSDSKIMIELDVNTNAYYTLRSRLNQKIEEYLLQQMENPRTDILKKVANINEIIFTKKKAIAVATLKKLEKELIDYDLSNELTIVYKFLKKLHINSPEYFNYSQLYNRHVAYTLAVDKAENHLAEYFKKYGEFSLSGDETDRLALTLFNNEMKNICSLYDSHRLYVYQSCMSIFHRLFVEKEEVVSDEQEPVEDLLNKVERVLNSYHLDTIYYHLELVYEFLKLEYYNHYKVFRKAEKYFEDVNESASSLLTNYSLFTYPAQFLLSKLKRALRTQTEATLYKENEALFFNYASDDSDIPKHISYITYRAISCYYADRFNEAARWLNNLLNEISLKKYPLAQLEIKVILALQYCMMNDFDLFNQLINSIQRQIRILGKENCEHILLFTKIMKISLSDAKRHKYEKIKDLSDRFQFMKEGGFTPTKYIKMDERFLVRLSREQKVAS